MLKIKILPILLLLPALLFAQQHFDIILKNGKIIDGTGNPWFYGDIGIVKDKGWIIIIGSACQGSPNGLVTSHLKYFTPSSFWMNFLLYFSLKYVYL